MKEYELEKEILISTINHEKHLGDNLKIRVNKYIDYLEGLEEKIKKFYEGEIYTCKQLKNIEENQKKYFINKQVIRDKIENLKSYKGMVMYEKYNYEAIIRHLEELLESEEV